MKVLVKKRMTWHVSCPDGSSKNWQVLWLLASYPSDPLDGSFTHTWSLDFELHFSFEKYMKYLSFKPYVKGVGNNLGM